MIPSGVPVAPRPFIPCPNVRSYLTLRAAWDHIRASRRPGTPYRCRVCSTWHVVEEESAA